MPKTRFNLLDWLNSFLRTPEKPEGSGVDVAQHIRLHRVLFLLLPALEAAGFQFSPDRIIRLKRLLALLPPATDGAALGHALCPVFATDAKQQTDFLAWFRQFYEQVLAEEEAEKAAAEKKKAGGAAETTGSAPIADPPSKTEAPTEDLPGISQQGSAPIPAAPLPPSSPSAPAPRRPLVVELDRCTDPPYTWNIVPDDDEVAVETGGTFGQTLLRLRRRETSETESLDVSATVVATIENGGRAELRYRRHTRPTEYLLLVERFSAEDHRAGLFDYFFQTLRANEVLVDRYFYQGDLRICRNEQHPAGLSLTQLRYRYPDSRLLVVGTGYRLISPATGELSEWAEPLRAWRLRVLLTPVAHAAWGQREQKLAEVFSLLPASLQSLHFVAESPEEAAAGQYDALPEYIRRIAEAQPLVLGEPVLRSLRQHFDPGLLAWIAACAIYPALHFDLTLRLGRLTSEALGYQLVTATNLLALARLPWFTAGQVPPEVRSELFGFLEARHPALHSRVIEYLHSLLARNPPPENSAAWAEHRINLALLTALRDEQPDATLLDELRAVVKRLDRPERRGDFVLPKKVLDRLGWEDNGANGYSQMVEMESLSPSQAKDWFEKEMQEGEVGTALSVLAGWLKTKYNNLGQMDQWKLEISALQGQLRKLERDVSLGKIKGEDTSREYGLLVVRIFNLKSSLWEFVLNGTTIEELKTQSLGEGTIVANRYRLERLIGRGGMADVWAAVDLPNDFALLGITKVSLKIYRRTDSLGAKLAQYEREMTQFLNHPNINKVLDFGMIGDAPYLVFPYYETSAWHQIGKATESDLWKIIHDIGAALEYMHGLTPPVLHNDLKPEHFMLDKKGNYVLADFGIAEEVGENASRHLKGDEETRAWALQKTVIPHDLAPEEVWDSSFYQKGFTTPATDIWHFAAALLKMATSQWPYEEQGGIVQWIRRLEKEAAREEPGSLSKSGSLTKKRFPRGVRNEPGSLSKEFSPTCRNIIQTSLSLETSVRPSARALVAVAKSLFPEMIPVRGGAFQMGEKGIAEPVHLVTLSDFEIGKYPVTQKLWSEIMGSNPSRFKGDDLPVENVSWDDCQEFLAKLNARFPGKHYRLPTEAEWEYAARGGTQSKGFAYAGSDTLDEVGWNHKNSDSKTHRVGQKKPNELGLHDMSGNVWEWCSDRHAAYPTVAQTDPKGPGVGTLRVRRGGGWNVTAQYCRSACRDHWLPDYRDSNNGFRLALAPQSVG